MKFYILTEEMEDSDGIRQSSIIKPSTNKKFLQNLMKERINEDYLGFIKRNGIADDDEDHFKTNFDNGLVEWTISEETLEEKITADMLTEEECQTIYFVQQQKYEKKS